MTFTITSWTASKNTVSDLKDNYPDGYALKGTVKEVENISSDRWDTSKGKSSTIYVYMKTDGNWIYAYSNTPGGSFNMSPMEKQ
jgi:hypothetical protein